MGQRDPHDVLGRSQERQPGHREGCLETSGPRAPSGSGRGYRRPPGRDPPDGRDQRGLPGASAGRRRARGGGRSRGSRSQRARTRARPDRVRPDRVHQDRHTEPVRHLRLRPDRSLPGSTRPISFGSATPPPLRPEAAIDIGRGPQASLSGRPGVSMRSHAPPTRPVRCSGCGPDARSAGPCPTSTWPGRRGSPLVSFTGARSRRSPAWSRATWPGWSGRSPATRTSWRRPGSCWTSGSAVPPRLAPRRNQQRWSTPRRAPGMDRDRAGTRTPRQDLTGTRTPRQDRLGTRTPRRVPMSGCPEGPRDSPWAP